MLSLTLTTVMQIALTQAPQVAPETVLAFAQAESALQPLAIHDSQTRRSYAPSSIPEALALARSLLADGGSLNLGLMQINSRNLSRTGLTVETAFDPAESVRAGGFMLVEAYQRCEGRSDDCLKCMASVYNTGRTALHAPYIARVWAAADQIVPAIRQAMPPAAPAPSSPPPPHPCGPPPPAWDGYAVVAYELCQRRSKELIQ
jgi:type IV secretion system protein VirB1